MSILATSRFGCHKTVILEPKEAQIECIWDTTVSIKLRYTLEISNFHAVYHYRPGYKSECTGNICKNTWRPLYPGQAVKLVNEFVPIKFRRKYRSIFKLMAQDCDLWVTDIWD